MTYNIERTKISGSNCGCFWINGGSVEGSIPFGKGVGVAASFSAEHGNVAPGIGVSQIRYVAGPRYTVHAPFFGKMRGGLLFGEALFGGVHAFDSIFPAAGGTRPSANALAIQLGGGMDLNLAKGFGIRAFEVDYVRTDLPNNGSNTQNDLRLAFGLSYRFKHTIRP